MLHASYDSAKADVQRVCFRSGYLDARFSSAKLLINPTNATAGAELTFTAGPQYAFGPLTIEQSILDPAFVAKYHDIQEGDAFDTRRLINLQTALNDTNYFSKVILDVRKDDAVLNRIPVVVKTEPRQRQKYAFGAGFGTDTGPRVSAGIESRRVNRRGHRYRLDARASSIANALQAEYQIPIKQVAKDQYRIYISAEQAEVGDADARTIAAGVAREDDWGPLRRRLFFNVERESFEFDGEPSRRAVLVYPGITLSYDLLDDPIFVRRGISLSATIQGGLEDLGSETSFLTTRLSGRAVLPLGEQARLLTGMDLGWIRTDEFFELPPSHRFFAGGDRSIRGYAFESVSPENALGDDIGGEFLTTAFVEVDHMFNDRWGVAAFVDAGEVSDAFPDNFRIGAGFGLRYRSPVGMIRLDAAHPFDDEDQDFRIHISVGPDL